VIDQKISTIKEFVPLIKENPLVKDPPLLIIAKDVTGEAWTTLVVDKMQKVKLVVQAYF
jgi:chaperonin GroEL (HSP60 family)